MTLVQSARPPHAALCAYLRERTAVAHQRLETRLDMLSAPSRSSIGGILQRFYGFHRVWEPGLHAWPRIAAFMAPRSRLDHLRADLRRLGCAEAEADGLSLVSGADDLLLSEASALGSAYVLEGSTLGGQVITRALGGAAWAPAEGISYFNPYGAATGAMWRDFKGWADGLLADDEHDSAAAGAVRTFALLEQWLAA